VGPRTKFDDVEKRKFLALPELELWLLNRPAHSQSLNWQRYPGSTPSSIRYQNHHYIIITPSRHTSDSMPGIHVYVNSVRTLRNAYSVPVRKTSLLILITKRII
jgi:hypothetical protein